MDYWLFCRWVEAMVARIPEELLRELNGGIQVEPRARRRPEDPPGVYLLGEYFSDPYLGRRIVLYYGSFRRVMAGRPAAEVRRQVWETLWHELRHHLEDLAGIDELGQEDRRQLEALWERWRAEGQEEA